MIQLKRVVSVAGGFRGAFVPVTVALCLIGGSGALGETANRIVAIVNDDIITQADVTEHLSALLEEPQSPEPSDADSMAMQEVVLRRLIEQRLILQEAKRLGLSVSGEEVAKRFDELRGRFATEEEFQQSLINSKLSPEQLKEKIRDQLMVHRVIDAKVRSTIVVSPQEVAAALGTHPELGKPGDRVRASHILIRVNERRTPEKAKALVNEIHQQLVKGADFSSLAKRYSEDPHAQDGGAMGWVAQGELLPELDAALFTLKPGELSGPLQTRLGFHLVKVEERRPADSLSLTEANHEVSQQLYQQKFQAAFTRWLGELKRHAYIEITH